MAELVLTGQYGALNTIDSRTMGYYVIIFYLKPTHYKETQPVTNKLVQQSNLLSRRSI